MPAFGVVLLAGWLAVGGASRTLGQESQETTVTVEGTNVNGIVFTWDVTNLTKDKAINYFEIPIYDINTFEAPEGWSIVSAPRLQKGEFILKTEHYGSMILQGRALRFQCMRPQRDVPRDGRVEAVVGFDDGTKVIVPNVLAPVKRSVLGVPVFLGGLLGIVFLARVLRGKKPAPDAAPAAQTDAGAGAGSGEASSS